MKKEKLHNDGCWSIFIQQSVGAPVRFHACCHTTSAFAPSSYRCIQKRTVSANPKPVLLIMKMANSNDDKDSNSNDVSDDGDMNTFRPTATSSLVTNLQSAFVAAAWAFLAIGFILNLFGYDYVMEDGHLGIDTMEKSQFKQEVIKASKSP